MLSGKELGVAIGQAIAKKGVKKAVVAREFGIKPPSLNDWIKSGRVGKQHLDKLVEYFSDVVPPSFWGLESLQFSHVVNGNQTNIAGDQNNNSGGGDQYNIQMSPMCETHEKVKQSLPDNLIKAMPLLDIDEAIIYATSENPTIEIKENIRVGTFVPHSGRTFGLKMPDDSMQSNGEGSEESIFKNDLLIIEPLIAPRDGDLVLVALENDGQKRGLIARLELDIRGKKQLIQTGRGHIADAMPENAVIGGVVIEIKRRLIALDVLESRLKAYKGE